MDVVGFFAKMQFVQSFSAVTFKNNVQIYTERNLEDAASKSKLSLKHFNLHIRVKFIAVSVMTVILVSSSHWRGHFSSKQICICNFMMLHNVRQFVQKQLDKK